MTHRHKVIFDTDPGVDDAMALYFLTRRPEFDLLAVTTVHGNLDVGTVTRNALWLVERLGLDVPVGRGAATPLARPGGAGAPHVHGAGGLGDLTPPAHLARTVDPRPGWQVIVDLVRAHPHEVTLIAVGPLTNLALALRHDPAIAGLVAGVSLMGGAFGTHGYSGNMSPVAEANILSDPEAADLVMTARWKVTILGLDVTQQVVMDAAYLDRLGEQGGPDGAFLRAVSRFYQGFHEQSRGLAGIFAHDSLAVIQVLAPHLFTLRRGPVRVVCGGLADGQTIQKPVGMPGPPAPAWDAAPPCAVAVDVDVAGVLALYADTFIV
ncbi:inosine-uridine preferring nucleoside hydrolase [Gluconacetobacter sacchari DSM 12717]|uniref:Nucleoside hydrolase n=2 Tax=Gluconacetobacter sacchari TaxID=92759 RepID=A0A7W4NLJ1_9PROT|nr:nucleoside hydrolase [Gluconacetobacter sacchari]MBB2159972.1 nucleoside hydrolase [Gluconacetobacter sacchari]GBQ27193.1 inosine-uridine preferring nucleoside hydrolase [Gluconacetobacter sacchari DSM 12717]